MSEERIRKRAYEIWQESDGKMNDKDCWSLAELDIWKEDYYRNKYRCPSCGRKRECLPRRER